MASPMPKTVYGNQTITPSGLTRLDIEARIKAIEESFTHINVAKDQEGRIVELESTVTELLDKIKEQEKYIVDIAEQIKNPIYLSAGSDSHGQPMTTQVGINQTNAYQNAYPSLAAQLGAAQASNAMAVFQNAFGQSQAVPATESLSDKAKRLMGIK